MKNRTKNRMKNTTKNKQQRRQKIKSRKNNMKRNAKRTLRRGMKGGEKGELINFNDLKLYNSYENYLSNNPPFNKDFNKNVMSLFGTSKSNSDAKPSDLLVPDTTPQPPPPPPPPQPKLPQPELLERKNKQRNSVKPYVPPTFKFGQQPLPYQPPPQAPPRPPQAPPRKQKRLALVEQRQLILTQILNKINYSFKLIQGYLVEIKNKLTALGYHFDAEELEQDIDYMKKNIETQIIPSTTYYFLFKNIFNNSYTEIYDYAIRHIMDMIKVINNEKTSYFVIFERTKDKNKKLEEIVKMFEIIKKEYKKIYNIVSELFDSLKFLQA